MAVIEFGLGNFEAWRLTPQEFWRLYSWKCGTDFKKRNGILTKAEIRAMKKELDDVRAAERIENERIKNAARKLP